MRGEASSGLVPLGGGAAEIASDGRLTVLAPHAPRRARPPARLARALFGTPGDAALTLVLAAVLTVAALPLGRWLVFDATFAGTSRADCTGTGACWVFIRARFGQFMYGFYPAGERWRVDGAGALLVLWVLLLVGWPAVPGRRIVRVLALLLGPPIGIWLLAGGFGLRVVETRDWGGLMLTVFLSVYGALVAVPLGIALALGRASRLPVIRLVSTVFIEFWRGVPIIAVIFLASLLLPLILPDGQGIDRLARAVIGLGLCIAAYMAEAVRGGLQAIPPGQGEAAAALGLGYWRLTGLVVLPQALRISLPALTNEFIALVKNTSLVLIVSIFDLLGIAQAALADPAWVGMTWEAYAFAGALYWFGCFGLSRWSRRLEARGAVRGR